MAAGRLRQLYLLLWKNWLFSIRSWKSTLLQLFAPCFFLLIVTALSYLPQGLTNVTNPPAYSIGPLPKCTAWNGKSCTSLLVLALNLTDPLSPSHDMEDCVRDIMLQFGEAAGLTVGTDSVSDGGKDIRLYLNFSEIHTLFDKGILNFFDTHDNQTQAAIAFLECHIDTMTPNNSRLNYTIMYNATRALMFQQLLFGSPDKPDGRQEIAVMVDSIFIGMATNRSVSISVAAAGFPRIYQQQSVESKQASSATLFLFCAITFQFVMMLYNVVSEKDLKLRQGLKLIGMKDSIYWISWAITGVVIAFLSTIVLMVTGYACQLQFFLNTNIVISFLLFFIYSCSMVPLAFFFSVLINTIKQAVNTGMVIFVVGLMVISLLGNPFILTQLYEYVPVLVDVLWFLPPFHLAKAMGDIGIAGSSTDINGLPQTPYHFGWGSLVAKRQVITFKSNSDNPGASGNFSHFDLPPTYLSYFYLILNGLLYGAIAWYLDAVVRGNHGIPRKLYFPILPSYWFDWLPYWSNKTKQLTERVYQDGVINGAEVEGTDSEGGEEDALLTRGNMYGAVDDNGCALKICSLKKTFSSGICCCKSKGAQPAVDDLSMDVQEHKILALLGHNGAGKSTTINMLTGLLEPDEGDAFFYNISVRNNLDAVRSVLGVCPQHDILWEDLTAREHMKLFGNLKDIPRHQMRDEITTLLQEVQLDHVADHRVRTFSGGMKRRLSVALSFLGDPKVMFLDEPTTGMDPRIRRDIWNLILRMKQNRVTIMTTHSMEEADILGDTIAIMATGVLRVMGTSVNLKNRFAGYSIELVVKHENVQEMMNIVQERLPAAVLKSDPIDVEGGGVLLPYNLPPDRQCEIVPFFKMIEGDSHISGMIRDYSISQTTLEQVFLNVTLSEYFKDQEYQPVLMRSGSYSATHRSTAKPLKLTEST